MSDNKKSAPSPKVNDKRRFDNEGNLRNSAEDKGAYRQEVAEEAAQESIEEIREETPLPPQEEPQQSISPDEVLHLQSELEAARARVDMLARAYQELERDKEDFKRRLQRERERMLELEKGKVALLLIEAADELELCLKNADDSPLSVGVRMIRENLLKKLKENEVVLLEVAGTVFDPKLAEAIDLQRVDNPDDNMKVLEVLRPGYAYKEQVIRPARVRVARHMPPADA
ncbi:MAG: nucleotide exchange factor GrpE [Cystobacterineae bacterium]|nr:nucleotide exchange factor GrpE [Cystobacterineae bacterium]